MANSYTLAGTAKSRGLSKVDPRLVQIIAAAAARSPYQVQIFAGKRAGAASGSRHNSGNALDIALIDPNTGQVIPNYKSSTGFPIYAEFAKIAREEQMRLAPDMANQFRWGGGFSDKDFDLMHFDFKPGGAMRYWTWQDGGKLTAAGAEAVPKFGAGWIYANGERRRAPPGQYASLWGREPLQAPQTAQSAIADLVNPGGGTEVAEPPTAAMGFAPTLPELASFEPPASAGRASAMPMPTAPPQFAQATGFPIDEALTGASAQDVLDRGPPTPPFRTFINEISGAPDPSAVPAPNLSARAQAEMARLDAAMVPPPRPGPERYQWHGGGAPDADAVPDPRMNPRRDPFGFAIDVTRPALANGDGSFSTEETTTFDAAEVGMPSEIVTVPTIVNGQRVSEDEAKAAFAAGQNPPVQRGFASFDDAETAAQARTDAIPGARATADAPFVSSFPARPEGPPSGMPAAPWQPTVAGRPELPATGFGPRFDMSAAIGGPPAPPSYNVLAGDRTGQNEAIAAVLGDEQFGPGTRSGRVAFDSYIPPEQFGPGNEIGRDRFDTFQTMQDLARQEAEFGAAQDSRFLAGDLAAQRRFMENFIPDYRAPSPPPGPDFSTTTPAPILTQNIPASPLGPTGNVVAPQNDLGGGREQFVRENFAPTPTDSTTGTWTDLPDPTPPGLRIPSPQASLDDQFNVAFSPGGPGLITDIPASFAARTPPPPTAQDGINSVFGAPPAQASVPSLAIPFAQVPRPPGIDSPLYAPTPMADTPVLPEPSPMPSPESWAAGMDSYVQNRFSPSAFGGGSVVRPPTPVPGQPGVVSGEMPTPEGAMDIRPPAQGGPAFNPMPQPMAEPPRQTNPGADQKRGALGRVLGGILGGAVLGPIGGLAGGLLGGAFRGGGGGFSGFGGQPTYAWSGGGSAPYGNNGGSTTYKTGTSNALGGSNALSWQGSGGQQVTVVQDPWTGTYYGPTTTGGGLY